LWPTARRQIVDAPDVPRGVVVSRILPASIVLLALAMVLPMPVSADTPLENHVISRDAYAVFTTESACSTVTVFVNSSTNMFVPAHGDGGGVVKQGLTSLAILVEDTCAAADSVSILAGGGGGGGVIADWLGQTQAALVVRGNLNEARLVATIPMEDQVSGALAAASVDLTWTATGPDIVRPSHIHVRWPQTVVLNRNSNDTMRDAVAFGTVLFEGEDVTPEPADGVLSTTRFHCRQIGFAQIGSDWGLCY
jgi:hypothetical protein